jgi:hypothetical protein
MTGSGESDYSFSVPEAKALALLLRRQVNRLDPGLDALKAFIEGYLYHNMTIDEAEVFFDEK